MTQRDCCLYCIYYTYYKGLKETVVYTAFIILIIKEQKETVVYTAFIILIIKDSKRLLFILHLLYLP